MSIKCFLVDDYPVIFDTLSRYIDDTPGLELIGHEINPLKAIKDIESGKLQPDVIFLDIEMPGMNGLEIAEILRGKVNIIFLTGKLNYGSEAFQVDAIDYILKPLRYERFKDAINRLLTKMNKPMIQSEDEISPGLHSVVIKGDGKGGWHRIKYDDILYIKSEHNYNSFFLKNKKLMVYGALQKIEDQFPKNIFLRVQRSYIVNINHVVNGDINDINMSNGDIVPIGLKFREIVQKILLGNE